MATPGLTTLCQLSQQAVWELAPANAVFQKRYVQGAVPTAGFGAGGNSLVVATNTGQAVPTQVTAIPLLARSVLLRNLSATNAIIYWFSKALAPPADGYSTLPALGTVAVDLRADQAPGLTFMPDPASTDAGLEVLITYYDPALGPGPQVPPFSVP